jgi:hypothetical protein
MLYNVVVTVPREVSHEGHAAGVVLIAGVV